MMTMTLARPAEMADMLGMTTEQLEDILHTKESPSWITYDGDLLYVVDAVEKPRIRSRKKPATSSANDLTYYFENAVS